MQLSTGQTSAEMREMTASPGSPVPEAVAELRMQVRHMADDKDPHHDQTVNAMQSLAEAVKTLPPGGARDEAARRINLEAQKLETSPKNAVHSDSARRALNDATVALEAAAMQKPSEGWEARIKAARASVDLIDPKIPYLEQREVIDRAFIDVANAFAVGTAARPMETERALGHRQTTVKLDRWAADMRGPSPDVVALCGGPAKLVRIEHTPADVTAAIFTFGWYTPVHVHVICPGPLKTVSR